MALLPSQDLVLHAPPRDVGDVEGRPEIIGEVPEHRLTLIGLEEAFASVVLLQHPDVGAVYNSGPLPKPQHQLESREFPIDREH